MGTVGIQKMIMCNTLICGALPTKFGTIMFNEEAKTTKSVNL